MSDLPPPSTIVVEAEPITPAAAAGPLGGRLLLAEDLRTPSGRVEDALRRQGDVQLFRRSSTRSSNPTADGLTARGLAGNAATRMLTTLDGVPLSDPFFGFVSWPSMIGRPIESALLQRGGGTGAAGPGALAGSLALTTAQNSSMMLVRGGSRDSLEVTGHHSIALAQGSWMAWGGHSRGDGHLLVDNPGPADVPSRYRQSAGGTRAIIESERLTIAASLSAFHDERMRGVEGSDITAKGSDASLALEWKGDWRGEAAIWAQLRDFASSGRSLNSARSVATPTLDQWKTPANGVGARLAVAPPLGPNASLTIGGDWRRFSGHTLEAFRFESGQPTRLRRAGGSQQIWGMFADGTWRLAPDLIVTAAGRLDHWRLADGMLVETDLLAGGVLLNSPAQPKSGWEPTARLAVEWRVAPAVPLRLAAYRGWRLPTLNELHRPFRAGQDATAANPGLSPERLWGVEGGIGWQPISALDFAFTVFANRLEGAIANVTIGEGPGTFPGLGFVPAGGQVRQRQNLDAIKSHGVEAEGRLRLGEWSLNGSAAYVWPRVSGGELDGFRPAQAPRLSASGGIAYQGQKLGLLLGVNHLGAAYDDDRNSRRLPPQTVLDAGIGWRLAKGLELRLDAENLTDADVVTGFSGSQPERGQPRTIWVGVRVGGS